MTHDPALPSAAWVRNGGDISRRVSELGQLRRDGALLAIAVERDALTRARRAGLTHDDEAARFLRAWDLAADRSPREAVAKRTGWARCELVLGGPKDACLAVAPAILGALASDEGLRAFTWQLVFTQIFAGEPERTLACDPGYDLLAARGNVVAWVEPYAGADWHLSQRYPTVTFPFARWAGQG